MEEEKIHFNIFEPEQYDKMIEELLAISKDLSPQEITKILNETFSLTSILGQPLTEESSYHFPFYRLRVWNKGDARINEEDPAEFSYPPVERCKMNRANIGGMQVLYGAGDNHTPFHEVAQYIKVDETIGYLAKWGIKKYPGPSIVRNMFYGLPFEGNEGYAAIMAEGLQEGIEHHFGSWPEGPRTKYLYGQKKFNELFCAEGKECYHITSSIIHDTFITMAAQGIQIPIVAYPSVAKKKDSVNFVIRKDFVDEHMYIQEIQKVIVKKLEKESVELTMIARGILVDNKIKWQTIGAELDKLDYSSAKVRFHGNPTSRLVGPNEKISICCGQHSMTVQEFFKKNNVSGENIMSGIENTYIGNFEKEFPLKVEREIIAVTKGNVYLSNNISPDARISHFIVPLNYVLSYV